MANKVLKAIKYLDTYGRPISLQYKGSDTFRTSLGAACTILTYSAVLIYLISLLIAFSDGSKQSESVQLLQMDTFKAGAFNLTDHNFEIQILGREIDPRFARIGAY